MHQIFWKSITLKVPYLIAPLNTPLEKEISKTSEMIWHWLHFYPRPVLAFGYYLNTFHVYWSRQSRVFRSLTSLLPIQPPTTRFLIHTNLETFLISESEVLCTFTEIQLKCVLVKSIAYHNWCRILAVEYVIKFATPSATNMTTSWRGKAFHIIHRRVDTLTHPTTCWTNSRFTRMVYHTAQWTSVRRICHFDLRPVLLTWINLNPSMDK